MISDGNRQLKRKLCSEPCSAFVHLLTTSLNAWTKTSTFHVAGPGVSSLSPNLSNETELFP